MMKWILLIKHLRKTTISTTSYIYSLKIVRNCVCQWFFFFMTEIQLLSVLPGDCEKVIVPAPPQTSCDLCFRLPCRKQQSRNMAAGGREKRASEKQWKRQGWGEVGWGGSVHGVLCQHTPLCQARLFTQAIHNLDWHDGIFCGKAFLNAAFMWKSARRICRKKHVY